MNLLSIKERMEETMTELQTMINAAKSDAANETDFKKEVFLASLLNRMLSNKRTEAPTTDAPFVHMAAKKLSIKEFMLQKKPRSDVEKVLVMGYFLEIYESMPCFNVDDIRNAFVKSKEPVPDNISDKIAMNIKKGLITEWIEKKENKKAYHLTSTGEQIIEGNLQNE